VFNEQTGRVRSLNDTGSIVWQQLDGTSTVGELSEAIAHALDVDPAVARADTHEFVRALLRHGFVERVR
jgi:hypothetical protein